MGHIQHVGTMPGPVVQVLAARTRYLNSSRGRQSGSPPALTVLLQDRALLEVEDEVGCAEAHHLLLGDAGGLVEPLTRTHNLGGVGVGHVVHRVGGNLCRAGSHEGADAGAGSGWAYRR